MMQRNRWSSASASPSVASGKRPSIAGSGPRRSTPPTRPRSTTWRSLTNRKATSTRHATPTRRPSSSNPTTRSSNRTTSCSRKSMTARAVSLVSSLAAAVLMAACTNYYEIPIETPIRPKLDVSAFQRVLVAGFLSGGSEDVDANLETTRLLRSQLRTKSDLRVIDVDTLPLIEVANESRTERTEKPAADASTGSNGSNGSEPAIKEEKDL